MPQDERLTLRAEGKDDKHVIKNLLSRHVVEHTAIAFKRSDHGDENSGGKENLLKGMRVAVTMSTGRAVGFVLDADDVPTDRWQAVRSRLADLGLALPEEIPEDGFVGDASAVQARVVNRLYQLRDFAPRLSYVAVRTPGGGRTAGGSSKPD